LYQEVVLFVGVLTTCKDFKNLHEKKRCAMRVFTLNDLQNKKIPRPGDFEGAFKDLSRGIKEVYQLSSKVSTQNPSTSIIFIGATVIGSMARKFDMRCTSDIDILMFFDDSRVDGNAVARFASQYRGFYVDVLAKAVRHNVPISIYTIFTSRLQSQTSRHSAHFLKHAINALSGFEGKGQSGCIVGDVSVMQKICRVAPMQTQDDVIRYISTKQEKLCNGYFSIGGLSQESTAKWFGNCFNAPFHSARNVLDLKNISYEDTKEGVIKAVESFSKTVAALLRELAKKVLEYSKSCDRFRDDIKNVIARPQLDSDLIYRDCSHVLQLLLDSCSQESDKK